jgi:hypothetical protein
MLYFRLALPGRWARFVTPGKGRFFLWHWFLFFRIETFGFWCRLSGSGFPFFDFRFSSFDIWG